jgi:sensor histidine kinase YesM
MNSIKSRYKKLIWQVPLTALFLMVLGNLIMLVAMHEVPRTLQIFVYGAVNSVVIGGIFMIGLTLIVSSLDRKLPWLQDPLRRLIVQVLVTIGFCMVVIVFSILLNGFLLHEEITSDFFMVQGIFMVKVAFTFVFLGSLISNAIMFFMNWKEAAVQQEKLKREQLALHYETLKSQVNPHFLFNNLNSLTSLISTNPEKAIEFVKKLSEVYRYVLDQKDCELVPLETELKFLESYVFLQKIRFETNLEVQIEVSLRNFKVIPLSIQMLVENAIKHNEISDRKPLHVRIYSTDDQYLFVENKLQRKAGSEGSGSGIQNIKGRYEFFTDKKVIISENGEKFLVGIPLLTD